MKKLFITLFVVFFSTLLPAQGVFEWSEQQIITDTVSVYSNPFVAAVEETAWVFYEKDEGTYSIYRMDLNNPDDSLQLLSAENINYSHPYFQGFGGSFLGHLFYLSDEEGADNLYSAKLFENDSLGEAIKVIENPENFDVMDYSISYEGYIGYTIDSNVYAAELKFYSDSVYTENVALLDSSSFNAQIAFRTLVWQSMDDDSSHIFVSNYEYVQDSGFFLWEEPQSIDTVGNCEYLISSTTVDYLGGNEFCWVKSDSVFGFSQLGSGNQMNTINTFSRPNVRQLSMVNWGIFVRYPYEEPHYLVFATGEGSNSEIFSSHGEMGGEDSAYISNNNYPDDNPRVFYGEILSSHSYNVYCIWQSHLSGGTALSMAKSIAFVWGSVEENNITDNYLKVSPNPFHKHLKIDVNTYGRNAGLAIFNLQGKQVKAFENIVAEQSWQSFAWEPDYQISKGVYLVVLTMDTKKYIRKVVLQ